VDLTAADGVKVGQTLTVLREDERIAQLKVVKAGASFTIAKPVLDKDFNAVDLFDKVEISL